MAEDLQLREYHFKYNHTSSTQGEHSVLNEVIEYGMNRSRFNSTVFSYMLPDPVLFTQSKNNTTDSYITYKSKLHFADFNGDGRADLLCLPDVSKGATWTGWRMYLNNGGDNFVLSDSGPEDYDVVGELDFNGDGKDDLIMSYDSIVGDQYGSELYKRYVAWTSVGNSFAKSNCFAVVLAEIGVYPVGSWSIDTEWYPADMDGDGKDEVFTLNTDYSWNIYSYDSGTGLMSFHDSGSINDCDGIVYGDFNGDSKTDIWALSAEGIKIYTYTGTSLSPIYSNTSITSAHNLRFGDFNADGRLDMFVYGYNDTDMADWEIHLSMGTGFDIETVTQLKANLKDDKVKVADLNGDGASDLMVMADENSPWTGHHYYITKRNAWGFQKYVDGTAEHFTYKYFIEDFDGDGRNDYLCIDGSDMSGWWNGYKVYKSGSNSKVLLKKISNGLNHLSTFNYESIAEEGTSYQKGTGASFPVMDFQAPLTVVSSVSSDDGVGGNRTINYTYEGAKLHRQGKGLIGFTATTSTDAVTGISTRSEFDYDNARFYARLQKTIQKKGTTLIGETTNTWDYKTTTGNIGFPYVSNSVQNNALNGHTVTNTFSYEDAYGNLKERKTIYEKGSEDVTLTVTNNIITNDVTNWRLGKVEQVIEKAEAPGEDPIVKTTNITYSTDGILKPDLIKVHEGTDWYYSRDHDYDSYGNLVQLVEQGANVSAKQTNYTYDPDNGIRLKTMIDPSTHETEYSYDGYGRLTKVEDYLDNSTAYSYDNMGRRTTVSSAAGFVTNTKMEWGNDANLDHELFYIENSGNDNSRSITWCDMLGREIRSDIRGFDGNDIYTRTIYDNKGQIDKVSLPSTLANTFLYNDYTFDDYGRIDLIAHHSGRNDDYSYEYGSGKVTQTVAGKTSWKITDSQGLLTLAHDNGGDIAYTYYPNGQVKNVTAPGNGQITSAVTAMKYDIAGNQTELSDPSAGTIIYKYDAFGRLKEQTNGRSQKTIYNYYADGRIDNIQNPVTKEGTTTYSYNGLEQLTGISNSATNVSKSFIYENAEVNGRLKTIEETIDGKVFSTTFEYDEIGRIKQRIHPSDIVEENVYQNGYLKSIKADNDLVWQVNSMNEFGQITGSSYGGEHSATHNYTAYGLPDDVTTGTIQSYDYTFDDTQGWPNYRENRNIANCYESFEYDTKNRLDLVKHSSTPWIDMEYQDNGNIITKTDVAGGTNIFEYNHSTKPYALTDVNVASIIPEVEQRISYTSFEQPDTISENNYKALFTYNDANQRCKMLMQQNGIEQYTRYYVGSRYMEETIGGTTHETYTWLGGDAYSAPAVSVKVGTGAAKIYYLFRDYLGTITHVVEKGNSANSSEYSFDAWGRRRKAASWNDYNLSGEPTLFAGRGFTGHEHLPEFGLINMNGRLYDPVLGRFLSPDNYVQAAAFTQSYNRYNYALNNPLLFTDPTGEKWKWKWLWPGYWLDQLMQTINDNTEDLRDAMMDANIPAFGGGYNSANGTFHYVGNSGNIYHNPPEDNASAAVYGAINNARAEYYAYHNWEPAGLDNVLNQQFVGTSPLANGVAQGGNNKGFDKTSAGFLVAGFIVSALTMAFDYVSLEQFIINQNASDMYNLGLDYTDEVLKIQKIGKGIRIGGGVLGMASIYRDYRNAFSPNPTISREKFWTNTGFTGYSFLGFSGAMGAGVYFTYDTFYPGGWPAATEAHRQAHEELMSRPYYNYFTSKY